MNIKNGPPTMVVNTPTGISCCKIVLVSVSAVNKNSAPSKALIGMTLRLSAPINIRHKWGTTSPTKPIIPHKETAIAVRVTAVIISSL